MYIIIILHDPYYDSLAWEYQYVHKLHVARSKHTPDLQLQLLQDLIC